MFKTIDLYLGVFLIVCGFGISLLNLRILVTSKNKYSYILLSENILIMCIGIAFLSRAVYSLNPVNMEMSDPELKIAGFNVNLGNESSRCGFSSLLLSYGPLVVSLVNSFLSLIVDNYIHYRMLKDLKRKDEQDLVREIGESSRNERKVKFSRLYDFCKKYFSFFTITLQWLIPILIASFMYPMGVKEMPIAEVRSIEDSCMAILDLNNVGCEKNFSDIKWFNITDLRKDVPATLNYLEVIENEHHHHHISNSSDKTDSILRNVLNILKNFNNHSDFEYTNIPKSLRRPKINDKCTKICFTDNKSMLLYMFMLAFISYFVPITISTVILTKIHIMEVNRPNAKKYVTRELLYNILFWTPVMFDTFLSLIICSFSMHGMRTSFFNVIANVYQAIKNFMNTRYFKDNTIIPSSNIL
ncbi:unnamed protein product [Euphydryas editha]|uniref:G-protein coupled receptors family 1 profile domain-containing protein n=1 Tax=Euphydryas editha TaxID=104508 RepID=A0AAU9UCY1_EUPED|nr:unnamed protein product [Euphydryas editha]